MITSVIAGTGSYIPETKITNQTFLSNTFFEKNGSKVYKSSAQLIDKFQEITGIQERRYATEQQQASDLGYLAALDALATTAIDKETLDYIIVAHNFGDIAFESNRTSLLPSLASRIKALLQIVNPACVAYDLPFGCPGWVEAIIQANYFIRSGDVKRCLVIGTETLSRIIDPHDRDSMIYSDGAGAAIVEAADATFNRGILAHKTETHAAEHAHLLTMDRSYSSFTDKKDDIFLKMNGRKVYEFALSYVPPVIKGALDKAGLHISDVNKVLIHQANNKMDHAILERVFKLYDITSIPEGIMPMTIEWLGNSSVATVPTLLDLILKGNLPGHSISKGDVILLASVGAGMNVNALVYRC